MTEHIAALLSIGKLIKLKTIPRQALVVNGGPQLHSKRITNTAKHSNPVYRSFVKSTMRLYIKGDSSGSPFLLCPGFFEGSDTVANATQGFSANLHRALTYTPTEKSMLRHLSTLHYLNSQLSILQSQLSQLSILHSNKVHINTNLAAEVIFTTCGDNFHDLRR